MVIFIEGGGEIEFDFKNEGDCFFKIKILRRFEND